MTYIPPADPFMKTIDTEDSKDWTERSPDFDSLFYGGCRSRDSRNFRGHCHLKQGSAIGWSDPVSSHFRRVRIARLD